MRDGGLLIVAEIAPCGEAVANIAHGERSIDVGETAGAGHTYLALGLQLGRARRAELRTVSLGHLENLLKGDFRRAARTRSAARQSRRKQPCEQSKIVHEK